MHLNRLRKRSREPSMSNTLARTSSKIRPSPPLSSPPSLAPSVLNGRMMAVPLRESQPGGAGRGVGIMYAKPSAAAPSESNSK